MVTSSLAYIFILILDLSPFLKVIFKSLMLLQRLISSTLEDLAYIFTQTLDQTFYSLMILGFVQKLQEKCLNLGLYVKKNLILEEYQ